METSARFGAVPRTAIILATLLILTALASVAIAFGSSPGPRPQLPPPFGPAKNGLIAFDSNGDVWVSNLDGSVRTQLTSGADIDQSPIFSPDGMHIAFWRRPDTPFASLMIMDANGEHLQHIATGLTLAETSGLPREPSWAHDSRRLAYADKDYTSGPGEPRINVVSIDGGKPVKVADPGEGPTWSPNDSQIAYRGGDPLPTGAIAPLAIYLVAANGTGAHPITTARTFDPYSFLYPQWSPDGTKLAYFTDSSQTPGNHDVWVVNTDGTNAESIANTSASEYWPVWSPDGARIAFDRVVDSGNNLIQFVVTDAGGSHPTTLQHPPLGGAWPTWSPDGTLLLGYLPNVALGTTDNMLVVDAAGATAPVTIAAAGNIGYSSWQRLAP